jgi:hypothetical protein
VKRAGDVAQEVEWLLYKYEAPEFKWQHCKNKQTNKKTKNKLN